MRKTISHPLRIVRCQNNLTAVRLAEEAKIGASTIWRAEHNYAINAESRRRLCEYFGKTSQELGLLSHMEIEKEGLLEHLSNQPHLVSYDFEKIPARSIVYEDGTRNLYDQHLETQDQAGSWLLFEANQLATLFDAHWTLDAVLESLGIILQGMQGIPLEIRHNLLQSSTLSLIGTTLNIKHISGEERAQLTSTLDKSIEQSWQIFHTSSPRQVIVLGQALLRLVQQTHDFLSPDICCSFYSTIYNLIGSGLYFQNHYSAAQQAHTRAYKAALEGNDLWNQAQSLNWQAIVANAYGHHAKAIQCIETALCLLEDKNGSEHLRLRAHLLANWAYNASILGDHASVERKLAASSAFLSHLDQNEEFDLARWHQLAGDCMLIHQQYPQAIDHLEQSLIQLPPQWLERRILTLIPLAKAYAHKQERDASIAVAKQAAEAINMVASVMLKQRFAEYLHILEDAFPRDKKVSEFVTNAQ